MRRGKGRWHGVFVGMAGGFVPVGISKQTVFLRESEFEMDATSCGIYDERFTVGLQNVDLKFKH